MKVGDLIIRKYDGLLALIVSTDRLRSGIIKIQFYAVPKEAEYGGWHCEDVVTSWRLQDESR